MLKLMIKHKGKILQEVELKEGQEYSIGRGKTNDVVLPNQPGISRQHLILSCGEDKDWVVKNLSQVSVLSIEGEENNEGIVPLGSSFQVKDFTFLLKEESPLPSNIPAKENLEDEINKNIDIDKKQSSLDDPKPLFSKEDSPPEPVSENLPISSAGDHTRIMDIGEGENKHQLSAYLKVSYDDNSNKDIFKLEKPKSEWVFGRDEEVDIVLDNANISREHFKIKMEQNQYYIKDLKSANGTILNDKELRPKKYYSINSGDIIYILNVELLFEIKNLSLEKELKSLKVPALVKNSPGNTSQLPVSQPGQFGGVPAHYVPPPLPANMPGVIIEEPEEEEESFFKKNKKRLIMYGALGSVLLIAFMFFDKEEVKPEVTKQVGELAGMPPEKQQIVRDTYEAAQLLFTQGKFEYCKSEVQKLHKLVESYQLESYQNSKQIEIACTNAAENKKVQYDIEQKKKKAEETEQFIQQVVNECTEKFNTFQMKPELIGCLNPAMELSPSDGRLQGLIDKFDAIELEKTEKREKVAQRKAFINSIVKKYNHAKSLYRKGKVLKAMAAYQNFINISNHKELKEKRSLAQRELASIKQNFNDTNNRLNSTCESQFKGGQFRQAYYSCKTASRKIPEPYNKGAISLMERSRQKLELVMKPLYEEAALNESVGNVSVAKEYWNQILSKDVDTGSYYKKAEEKLNNY